jgi:hypothetical protein
MTAARHAPVSVGAPHAPRADTATHSEQAQPVAARIPSA